MRSLDSEIQIKIEIIILILCTDKKIFTWLVHETYLYHIESKHVVDLENWRQTSS